MMCQFLHFICNNENMKCLTLVDFQPPCHNNDQVSGELPKCEARIGLRWIQDGPFV